MQPEIKKLLFDMLTAANSISEFTIDKSLLDFQNDALLRPAVYFQFIIIGEALAQLREMDKQTTQKITESSRIIGFRNQIVHGYSRINDEITLRIIRDKLPILKKELNQLLAE